MHSVCVSCYSKHNQIFYHNFNQWLNQHNETTKKIHETISTSVEVLFFYKV